MEEEEGGGGKGVVSCCRHARFARSRRSIDFRVALSKKKKKQKKKDAATSRHLLGRWVDAMSCLFFVFFLFTVDRNGAILEPSFSRRNFLDPQRNDCNFEEKKTLPDWS